MLLQQKLSPYNIILGSASPRRRELFSQFGLKFSVLTLDIEETFPASLSNEQIAMYLARLKADNFKFDELAPNTLLITADTIVCFNNEVMNKPADYNDALRMLTLLSGGRHEVITGMCIRTAAKTHCFYELTEVYFNSLSAAEIDYYISNYKPFDKAGAYGIQEWIGNIAIQRIDGSYTNVVGLPTQKLYSELLAF
ncbi:MAG: septum formation protein Maf [Bacteroidales bacterium]|nr:septum formation protein Maf [Bacteroidales bacterium]